MMETSSLIPPKAGGHSRYSKALPEPPSFGNFENVVLPVRKDSLAARPPLPPKDTTVRPTAPSPVASKPMESPLPPFPGITRINSPPTSSIPKRKPVGSGSTVKSPPPPQPIRGDDMSPVESLPSLSTAPGTGAFSATRSSGEITSPKESFIDPSSPKVLLKDTLGGPTIKPTIISPLSLPTPVYSKMEKDGSQGQPGAVQEEVRASRPPSSPTKGSQTPTTPNDSKALPSVPAELTSTSPKSLTNQSASQPQLWRRRSVKSDKTLAVAELKLTLSHGSTAASTQQADSPLAQDSPLSKPLPPVVRPQPDSPILKSPESNPGHIIRPSASNKSLPRDPPTEFKGNKKSKDDLDGFSQYAQEVENRIANGTYKASDLSPARTRTPEIRHPPTPDYAEDETRGVDVRANMSPASPVYPITPPNDGRPLSMIPEDFVKGSGSTRAGPPPTGPLPALPPRSSSRSSPSAPVTPRNSLPRYSAPAGRATPEATSSAAVHAYDSQAGGYLSPRHAQNISSAFAPSIEVSDDDDFSTIRPSSSSRHATSTATNGHNSNNGDYAAAEKEATNGVPASPGEPDYYPVLQNYGVYLPGDVIPAPPLKEIQLDCFSGHAVFVFSKNDDHPVGCMACKVEDKNARFTCSHCSARLCVRCRDALMVNGRDLRGWVEALMG